MKRRIMMIILLVVFLGFVTTATYSAFKTNVNVYMNQEIAEFIVNTERTDHLELPITDLNPGDSDVFEFSVSNIREKTKSHVSAQYQIVIQTYHFIPLDIELYKVENENEELIMVCDETYTRNKSNNTLVCNSEVQEMTHEEDILDNYIVKVNYKEEYNTTDFSDLVDFIDITIKSWQKIKDIEE